VLSVDVNVLVIGLTSEVNESSRVERASVEDLSLGVGS
jgi:hypothetical protein